MPTTSYLVAIETLYRYKFKSNYLKNKNLFTEFSLTFWHLHESYSVRKKNELHRSIISGVIDSESWAYLNAKQCFFLKIFRKSMCYLGLKTPEICIKVHWPNIFIILIQIELEKAIFNLILDFRTAS